MGIIYLTTSYREKDYVKKRGAKYDPEKKRWYIYDDNEYLPELRTHMGVYQYANARIAQESCDDEERAWLTEIKNHIEEVREKNRKAGHIVAILDLSDWYGWKPGD